MGRRKRFPWRLVIGVSLAIAATAAYFFLRRTPSTLPVPGESPPAAPRETIRPGDKQTLEKILEEKERQHAAAD